MWCLVIAVGLLRFHTVQADFGIPPVIEDATSLQQLAISIVQQTNDIESAYGNIVVDGNVPQFNEAGTALKAVYAQIVNLIRPICQSLQTLAVDDVGPVETLFDDTNTKIVAMQTFIANTAPALLATVQAKVSVYVRNELYDIFMTIKSSLSLLKNALGSLRTGLINARTSAASNGGVYTNSNIQNNVKSSLVTAVLTATLNLQGDLPVVLQSADESARTILEADQFVQFALSVANGDSSIESWESGLLTDYQVIVDINTQFETLANTELPLVTDRLGMFTADFSTLVDPLDAQYNEVSSVFGQITSGTDVNVLNAYKTLVSSVTGFVQDMVAEVFPPIKPVIYRLSEILVERSPYADFCYETYYPKVEQYLYAGETIVLACMDDELDREKSLKEALLEVLYVLQFFLEDTNEYLNTCYRLSLFDEQLANECLQEHTAFSEIIPCTVIKEYATLLQLLCKEVDSIRFRLWACMSRDTVQFPVEVQQLALNIETCRANGPLAPV